MERKNISQPEEAWAAWDRQAAAMDMTLSGLIFEAMNEHLGLFLTRKTKRRPKSKPVAPKRQKRNSGLR
jgi:hypothetical protein